MSRHIRKVGPETRDIWWDPRPEAHLIGGAQGPESVTLKVGPETRDPRPGTLKVYFLKKFSVFSDVPRVYK